MSLQASLGTYSYSVYTASRSLLDVLHRMALELVKVGGNEVERHGRVERGRAFACDDAGEETGEGVFEDAVVAGAALHLKQTSPSLRCRASW